ncbi:MAG TPA: phosphate ABC transporter permease subunit PstC [Thermobifida alba]|uniref:phosphate ABC transporter permease subunit PstC n=1 Tax=Thermobifida cellulosilytica TaxID=144786 RepID=UPI000A04DB15|nr:phosphate ABC transporter permease subunit PstC [Thermobifida cellulosilytica]HLU99223.1 phosphate ABC transporter permease subunit PstC [Thermobifida alba]
MATDVASERSGAPGERPAAPAPPPDRPPARVRAAIGPADLLFRGYLRGGGGAVLVVMTLVGVFLAYQGYEALRVGGWEFFTTEEWNPDSGRGAFGIAAVLVGTVIIALIALVISVPLALGTALYICEYAPARSKPTLIAVIDLMAAVPSIVYALWGFYFLQWGLAGVARWMHTYLGWIPFLDVPGVDPANPLAGWESTYTSSSLVAGIVVALMVTPIACSVMREVFDQAPQGEREGAYALGATKWGMIRSVVLPFGAGGIIGGSMLGLGRALGETIGVYLVISTVFQIQPHILMNGGSSIPSLIALRYNEATPFGMSALMAAGLVLFLMTLVVNFAASSIIARSRSGAASEA